MDEDDLRFPWIDLKSQFWKILSILIGSVYLVFFIVTVVQLCLLLYYRHRFPSYHSTVLIIGSVLTGMRVLFFGKGVFFPVSAEWVNVLEEILCWIPMNLQYLMITMLFIYYCKLIYGRHWKNHRSNFVLVWGSINALFFVLTIVWLVLVGDSIQGPSYLVLLRYLMVCIPDAIVITGIAVFTYLVSKINTLQSSVALSSGRSPWRNAKILNVVLIFTTFVRLVFYLLMILYLFPEDQRQSGFSRRTFEMLRCTNYVVSELIPVFAILLFLRQIPGTSVPIARPYRFAFSHDTGKLNPSTPNSAYHVIPVSSSPKESQFIYGAIDEQNGKVPATSPNWFNEALSRSKSNEFKEEIEPELEEEPDEVNPISPSPTLIPNAQKKP